MFQRLVGKHQVENLLLAALKGVFMQRLSLDFELATGAGRILYLNADCQWQMEKWIFVFDQFSLMLSAACTLTGVLLNCVAS